jgi:cellulose synthase/poly-beta-1,6-N-acetylglucosamine synthase-like glycosyltransferase
MMTGVSFVVPVRNGAPWIRDTLAAIAAEADGRPMEIIVVDDGSEDGSVESLNEGKLRIIHGEGRGAAAAINRGLQAARFPIICQVDQDVTVHPGWMRHLVNELDENPIVGAVQGYYVSDRGGSLCARAMGLDLEERYAGIEGCETDHVCTGNTAYRAVALRQVGFFDEALGYGYDNDISYRLRAAGFRLRLSRAARSTHRWRDGLGGYLVQQYGFGYGRIDLVAKHPRRWRGDAVSPTGMMLHPLLVLAAMCSLGLAAALAVVGGAWSPFAGIAFALVLGLAFERLLAGVRAARRFSDPTALVFPVLHLMRDAAWVAAIVTWSLRWLVGHPRRPHHSMSARPVDGIQGAEFGIQASRRIPNSES